MALCAAEGGEKDHAGPHVLNFPLCVELFAVLSLIVFISVEALVDPAKIYAHQGPSIAKTNVYVLEPRHGSLSPVATRPKRRLW